MIASLQGLDVLIFTGGIGENVPLLREEICRRFSFLGLKLNKAANQHKLHEDSDFSIPDSPIRLLLIHTQEEFEIAKECFKVFTQPI